MRRNKDGRAVVELGDIDLAYGVRTYKWFWLAFAILLFVWALS